MTVGPSNIYLSGFMGAGKTTVGKQLARHLALPFHDLDAEIVDRAGKPISAIFSEDGEACFRQWELDVLRQLSGPAVVSLGGGAPMQEAVRRFLGKSGTTIFLYWPFDVLLARVAGDPSRPLAQDPEKMRNLYAQRLDTYRLADFTWQSAPPHKETVGQILTRIKAFLA